MVQLEKGKCRYKGQQILEGFFLGGYTNLVFKKVDQGKLAIIPIRLGLECQKYRKRLSIVSFYCH